MKFSFSSYLLVSISFISWKLFCNIQTIYLELFLFNLIIMKIKFYFLLRQCHFLHLCDNGWRILLFMQQIQLQGGTKVVDVIDVVVVEVYVVVVLIVFVESAVYCCCCCCCFCSCFLFLFLFLLLLFYCCCCCFCSSC